MGLRLGRTGVATTFQQPCACFDGRLCTAYEQRPTRCRQFDCHTLQQAKAGEIQPAEALGRIRAARREAGTVVTLLRDLGQTDEHLPLTKRYQALMHQPIDLTAGEEAADLRGQLMLAVNSLMQRLQRDFLT